MVANGKDTTTLPFDAAYGRFEVTPFISSEDVHAPLNYVLINAQGKGTAATSWYLNIYKIRNHQFVSMYRKQIAGYFGPANIWWYEVDYARMLNGTPEILLTLRISSSNENKYVIKSLIPKDKFLKIYWDNSKHEFVCGPNPDDLNAL